MAGTNEPKTGNHNIADFTGVENGGAIEWVRLLLEACGETEIVRVILGGSASLSVRGLLADIDLFVHVQEGCSLRLAAAFQSSLRENTDLLVATLAFRVDFGIRVRVAKSPLEPCSFFFVDAASIRNVAHQRLGYTIWPRVGHHTETFSNHKPRMDAIARQEELQDALLDLPSAIKYLAREDWFAAAIRLDKVLNGLVNWLTLDSSNYAAGYAKKVGERLSGILPTPPSMFSPIPTAETASRKAAIIGRLLDLVQRSGSVSLTARERRYIEEALLVLAEAV